MVIMRILFTIVSTHGDGDGHLPGWFGFFRVFLTFSERMVSARHAQGSLGSTSLQ